MIGEHPDAATQQRAEPVVPAPPAVVSQLFNEYQDLLCRYVGWLAGAGTRRGLIGPREVPRLWGRHILNSIAMAEVLPQGARLVDIGTGAGLPGLAVACIRPDLRVDLVESLQRRTEFLSEVVADLDLTEQIHIVHGRAEHPGVVKAVGSSRFVTARAVAPLDRLVRWAFPLLESGGSLLALKGSSAEAEISRCRAALTRARAVQIEILECGVDWLDQPTRVVRIVRP